MGGNCAPERHSTASLANGEGWLDFDSDLCAVHVMTEDGIIQSTNRTFDRLFGADHAEFVGKHHATLNNHSVAVNLRLLRDIRHGIDTAGSWRGILTCRHSRGTEFTSRAQVYPLRCGGVRRLVCFQQPERGIRGAADPVRLAARPLSGRMAPAARPAGGAVAHAGSTH